MCDKRPCAGGVARDHRTDQRAKPEAAIEGEADRLAVFVQNDGFAILDEGGDDAVAPDP